MSAQRPSVFIKSEEIAEAAKHFSAHMQSIRTQELESQISPLLEMNELALASLEKSLAGEREVSQRDGVLAHQDSKMGLADSVLKAFLADIQQKYEAQETQYHQRMSEYRSAVGRVTQQVIGHARALLAESFKLDWSDPAAIDLKNVALCGVVRLNNILNDHRQADEKSIAESTKKIWQLDSKLLTQKDATSEAIKSARALAGLQQKLKQLQTQCDHLHRVTCKKEAQLEKMQAQFESELKQVRVRVAVAPSWPKERSPLFHGISFLFAPPPAAASALTPSTPEFAPSHLGSPLYMMPAAVSVIPFRPR
ncbi:MAG: hypothetical protein EBX40_07010 [Gammaproteobacteria bacterium]|nr:hypothetical protein [Gammaproteobacteria bacterium]